MPWPIAPKQDDPQRLLALNGVPQKFWFSAEEINEIIKRLSALLGEETSLFKGEFDYMEELEQAHPLPEPGSTAHLRVVNGDDIFCRWDNTDKKWIQDGLVKDQPTINIDIAENIREVLEATGTKYYGTKDGVAGVWEFPGLPGEPVETVEGFKVYNFQNGYQGGLTYKPYADFEFQGTRYSGTHNFLIDTSTIPAGERQFAAFVLNSNGTVTLVYGATAVNPPAPNIDAATQLIPDGGLVLLSSGAAAPDEVTLQKIYAENAGVAGGEWDPSIIIGAGRWNFASNEAETGAFCIKGTALVPNDLIKFTAGAAIPVGEFTQLVLKMKNLVDLGLPAGNSGGFRFILYGNSIDSKGRVRAANVLLPSLPTGGFDVTNTASWQYISLPVGGTSLFEVTGLGFVFDPTDTSLRATILLDEIKYNDGSAPAGENFATVGFVERVIAELRAYVDQQDAAMFQAAKDYADSLAIGGPDHLHDSYDTVPLMIAGQGGEQIDGEYFIVIDASGDPTVDAGWALYEYLGTTLGTLDDYRKLSEEESLDIIQYDYSQDIADVQAEVDALELRVTALEAEGNVVLVSQSRALTASDNKKTLCIADAGIILTYTAANLPTEFKINVATNASGTCGMDGDTIDGATFLAEGSMGHFFRWPGTGAGTTKGDWE